MPIYDLNEFLRLSAALNYQLSAAAVGRESILGTIFSRRNPPPFEKKLLLEAVEYLEMAYQSKHRRLGPMAILHPLRATSLLARAARNDLEIVDLLSMLLHDKLEDITAEKYEKDYWDALEQRFEKFKKRMDDVRQWYLMERIGYLTKKKKESYYSYIGKIVEKAPAIPALIRVKLADRLDNTLDMRIDIEDPLVGIDFFQHVFQLQFVPSYKGYSPVQDHPPPAPMNGAMRLYELYKNVVAVSLIRQKNCLLDHDSVARELFEAICIASIRESERIIMHVFGYHLKDVERQRRLLDAALDYCRHGGISTVTQATENHRLDGFIQRFDNPNSAARKAQLVELYKDKELIVQGAFAFIALFQSFLDDPAFYLRGISSQGIQAPQV